MTHRHPDEIEEALARVPLRERTGDDIPLDELSPAIHRALVRLHLKLTGDVHAALLAFAAAVRQKLEQAADEAGNLAPTAGPALTDGSPPRVWGIRQEQPHRRRVRRFTPTRVGNTCALRLAPSE